MRRLFRERERERARPREGGRESERMPAARATPASTPEIECARARERERERESERERERKRERMPAARARPASNPSRHRRDSWQRPDTEQPQALPQPVAQQTLRLLPAQKKKGKKTLSHDAIYDFMDLPTHAKKNKNAA